MRLTSARGVVAAALILFSAVPVLAQQRPTAAQAQSILQNQPDVVARLQSMIQSSGMTQDQIRARLRAEGYPESLLDSYLPGGAGADANAMPGDEVFAAVQALGLGTPGAIDSLQRFSGRQRHAKARLDSAFLDSVAAAAKDAATRDAIRSFLKSRAGADSGFSVFGINLFDRETTQFDPNVTGAVDANYQFGPGDRLVLILTGDVEAAYQLEVSRAGFVVIPQVGQVPVANLTMNQLEDLLYSRLGRVYSGVRRGSGATTHFSVTVSRLGTNQVYVTGDVKQPGSYQISRAGTLMNALYAAGGPTDNGSMRAVQLRRDGKVAGTFDVYDYVLHGDASRDLRLENGDIVFVPPRGGRVRISGGVLRPATYELKAGQTLPDLIQMAGGFAAAADRRRVQIERIVPPAERTAAGSDRRLIDVSSQLFNTGFGPPEPLQAGDVVRVFDVAERVADRVVVSGNVWAPGPVALAPGMHLSDALHRAGGLKPDSYLGEVQISRLLPDSSRIMIRSAMRDTTGAAVNDLVLQDGDAIQVFSLTDFRPKRYVTIGGAVRKPGRIPYHDGMTVRDLVLLAGGVEESALLTEAEIARLPENRAAGVTATTIRVPLDSTYLFDRLADGRYLGPPGVPTQAGHAADTPLQPYDAVLIMRQPNWELQRMVTIGGEVRYPGTYALKTRNDRLSDIIQRAGGLTSDAYAAGISFVRGRDHIGRIGVSLPDVLRDPRDDDNLLLVDGDSIFIPVYSPVVSVKGSVNNPVSVSYVPGADLDYYIRAAGGGTAKADLGRAFVLQSNGKYESRNSHLGLFKSTPHPQPGSTVSVPEKDPSDKRDWLALATTTTSLLGSLVAIAALLRR